MATANRGAIVAGWLFVAVGIVVLFVFGGMRTVDVLRGVAPTGAFELRYAEHPRIALAHMLPGLIFTILAPLQFVQRIRTRFPRFHRWLGRALIALAAVSGIAALVINLRFPAFGGLVTQLATLLFGSLFLLALVQAFVHARARRISLHREWMIRMFALAIGVASIRAFIALLTALTPLTFERAFGLSFWLGFGTNLLIAEAWIRHTRPRDTRAAVSVEAPR